MAPRDNRYAWRLNCEDGSAYGIDPNDYETRDEYNEALNREKHGWRDYCEDGSDYGISPEDYETEEEYDEALENVKADSFDADVDDELIVTDAPSENVVGETSPECTSNSGSDPIGKHKLYVHTASAWRILESYVKIPVEHIMIERIKQNKSLVDIKLTARACQEHYQKQVDSFVIVSSDSDYWGLISSLSDARFLVMIEREKCGPDMKTALADAGIFYCYLDDFYSGNSEDIKKNALFKEMYRWIDNSIHLNVNDMFNAALRNTRIEMSPAERRQFYEKHIRHMTLTIDENGNVSIELKRG